MSYTFFLVWSDTANSLTFKWHCIAWFYCKDFPFTSEVHFFSSLTMLFYYSDRTISSLFYKLLTVVPTVNSLHSFPFLQSSNEDLFVFSKWKNRLMSQYSPHGRYIMSCVSMLKLLFGSTATVHQSPVTKCREDTGPGDEEGAECCQWL